MKLNYVLYPKRQPLYIVINDYKMDMKRAQAWCRIKRKMKTHSDTNIFR